MNSVIGSLPKHQYLWVDSRFTHEKPSGWVRAVWFGLVSKPGRAWGCNIMLECGAVYREVPPHALAFCKNPAQWAIEQSQMWDCYGHEWSAHEYKFLRGLKCTAYVRGNQYRGTYLFTVCPVEDGFSEAPEQAKEFMFVELDNGRLTIQPTNRLRFEDLSFTDPGAAQPLKLQTQVWSCEDTPLTETEHRIGQ